MMFRAARGKVAESRPFDDGFVFPSPSYCFCRCCDCFCFFCCCCCYCFCCRCSSSRLGDRKDDRVCCRRASWQRRLGAREETTITIVSSWNDAVAAAAIAADALDALLVDAEARLQFLEDVVKLNGRKHVVFRCSILPLSNMSPSHGCSSRKSLGDLGVDCLVRVRLLVLDGRKCLVLHSTGELVELANILSKEPRPRVFPR